MVLEQFSDIEHIDTAVARNVIDFCHYSFIRLVAPLLVAT